MRDSTFNDHVIVRSCDCGLHVKLSLCVLNLSQNALKTLPPRLASEKSFLQVVQQASRRPHGNMDDPNSLSSSADIDDCLGNRRTSSVITAMKLLAASALFYSAGTSFAETYHASSSSIALDHADTMAAPTNHVYANAPALPSGHGQRRLSESNISLKNPPSYMTGLMEDLKARRKLMEETPPDEVKYWFEYTGPLQVRFSFFDWYIVLGGKGRDETINFKA